MNFTRGRAAAMVVAGVVLGAPLGLVLDAGMGQDMVLLGAISAVGWFLGGVASGRWGSRVEGLRAGLVGLCVAAFSSWVPLAIHGPTATGDILIAFIEVAFGLAVGVVGHVVAMPRGRDL